MEREHWRVWQVSDAMDAILLGPRRTGVGPQVVVPESCLTGIWEVVQRRVGTGDWMCVDAWVYARRDGRIRALGRGIDWQTHAEWLRRRGGQTEVWRLPVGARLRARWAVEEEFGRCHAVASEMSVVGERVRGG